MVVAIIRMKRDASSTGRKNRDHTGYTLVVYCTCSVCAATTRVYTQSDVQSWDACLIGSFDEAGHHPNATGIEIQSQPCNKF